MLKVLCPNFFGFCPNFRQIKTFGGCACNPCSCTTGCSLYLLNTFCRYKSLFGTPKVFLSAVQLVQNGGPFLDTVLKFCELMI